MFDVQKINSLRPAQALSNMAAQYAMGVANELRVDADMVACAMLSAVMIAGMNRIDCVVKDNHVVPGVMWILVGAPSGAGKSPAFHRVQGVLENVISEKWCLPRDRELEIELNRAVLKQRIKWLGREAAKHSSERRHEVLTEMQACQGELNELKIPVSPVIDRVSVYSFIEEMSARDGVMAALGAEGSLLANLYAVSPEMIQPILKSWSMEPISEVTKKNGITVVSHPRLHIGTAWQITESRKIIFAEKFSSIGLDSRFLYCELPKHTFSYGDGRNLPV